MELLFNFNESKILFLLFAHKNNHFFQRHALYFEVKKQYHHRYTILNRL